MDPDSLGQFITSAFAVAALIGCIFACAKVMDYLCDVWQAEKRRKPPGL